jgi:hypothetical protein
LSFVLDTGSARNLIDRARTGYEFPTTDLQPLEASVGARVDGILGYEIFSRFAITVDYKRPAADPDPPGSLSRARRLRAVF